MTTTKTRRRKHTRVHRDRVEAVLDALKKVSPYEYGSGQYHIRADNGRCLLCGHDDEGYKTPYKERKTCGGIYVIGPRGISLVAFVLLYDFLAGHAHRDNKNRFFPDHAHRRRKIDTADGRWTWGEWECAFCFALRSEAGHQDCPGPALYELR